MTKEFVAVNDKFTVNETLNYIQNVASDIEFVYYIYSVSNDVLNGVVSLKQVISANGNQKIRDLLKYDLIIAEELEDQSSVIEKIAKYNLFAIPVVNNKNVIKGIVTVDDALTISLYRL